MALANQLRQELGEALFDALCAGTTLAPLTTNHPDIDIEDAYHISRAMLACRIAQNSEQVVGKKIGVTSAVVQKMLGVFQPDFGFLTNTMAFANGADIPVAGRLIQPRAEGEIAFVLKKDLRGTAISEDDVLAATDYITPCFEIVDSRIDNWQIKIKTLLRITLAVVSMCWATRASIRKALISPRSKSTFSKMVCPSAAAWANQSRETRSRRWLGWRIPSAPLIFPCSLARLFCQGQWCP